MVASKSRAPNVLPPEPTARPKSISEELTGAGFVEEGLSIDPEDLGAQFLVGATEQSNFESLRPADLSNSAAAAHSRATACLVIRDWDSPEGRSNRRFHPGGCAARSARR